MLAALFFHAGGGRSHRARPAIAVTVGGVLQLGWLIIACKRAGIVLKSAQAAS